MRLRSVLKVPVLCLIFALLLLNNSGCSIAPYPTDDISKNPKAVNFDNNDIEHLKSFPFYELELEHNKEKLKVNIEQDDRGKIIDDFLEKIIANSEPGTRDIVIKQKYIIKPLIRKIDLGDNKTFSVKYHRSYLYPPPNASIPVEFPNGRKYTALLDTGDCLNISLTSDIVVDNNFVVIPELGECHIPLLNIGTAKIKDTVGFYESQQWQFRMLNIPIYKQGLVFLGLGFIKSFNYVMFDNVEQKVVFSEEEVFEPEISESWISFPFEIKPDEYKNERIMVQMPINKKVYELFFDTCGSKPGLSLSQDDWELISKDLTFKNLRKSDYLSWQAGRLPCQRATVSEISIGGKILKNADVLIYGDPEHLSMFSLGYFQDTVVVLDFVNNLLWIKN